MTEAEETYYTRERWQNWLTRVEEEDLDPENEDSARLLFNLQDDTAIAVAKVVSDYDDGVIDEDRAMEEIAGIREVVLDETEFDDEEKQMLIESAQTSLVCVFYTAEEYVAGGPATEASVEEYIDAAAAAEAEEDMDAALSYVVQAGTRIIDGEELDVSIVDELEYGFVSDWVSGLDSLQNALSDPEVVEEEDE